MKNKTAKDVKRYSSGISVIEVVIAATIILVSVVSIISLFGNLTSLSIRNTPRVQAAMLLEEGTEALRIMRDAGWGANINPLADATTYRLLWQNSRWTATTSSELVDGFFDRTFTLSAVSRDATSYDIVTSGGSVDIGTRKVIMSVAWNDGTGTTTKSVEFNIYNTFSN